MFKMMFIGFTVLGLIIVIAVALNPVSPLVFWEAVILVIMALVTASYLFHELFYGVME
jgi:hypothetical protein